MFFWESQVLWRGVYWRWVGGTFYCGANSLNKLRWHSAFFPFEFIKLNSRSFVIKDEFNSRRCVSAVQVVSFAESHYNKLFIAIILAFAHPGHTTIKNLIRSILHAEVFRIFKKNTILGGSLQEQIAIKWQKQILLHNIKFYYVSPSHVSNNLVEIQLWKVLV